MTPATAWHTQYYLSNPRFGGLKNGTGLILDMGLPVKLSSLTVSFGAVPGADVDIKVGNSDIRSPAALAHVHHGEQQGRVGGTVTFGVHSALTGRYVLIWFTRLPPQTAGSAGTYEAEIFSVTVRAQFHPAAGDLPQGEHVELPGFQVDEQPRGGQLIAVPLEYLLSEDVGEPPAPAGQVRPVQRDLPLGRLPGEVDHHHMPAIATIPGPGPGQQVAAGLVVRPPAHLEQSPRTRPYLVAAPRRPAAAGTSQRGR